MDSDALSRTQRLHRLATFGLLALLVCLGNAWLVRHPPAVLVAPGMHAPEWPVLVDVLVTVPLLYLFLFRRNGRRALAGTAMIAVSGIMVAGWIVPIEGQHWLGFLRIARNLFAACLVAGEIALAIGLARLTLRLLRDGNDPELAVASALRARFGDTLVARLLAFEVRLWFYALFATASRKLAFKGDAHFSCHAKDGLASNQLGFIVLIGAELPLVHVMLSLFGQPRIAWAVSLLSVWGLCFLIAERRATLRRPISIDAAHLYVRYGLGSELVVPLSRIGQVAAHREAVARRTPGALRYCEAGVPNVCIHLDPAIEIPGLLGETRLIRRIYLGVDAPGAFIRRLADGLRGCTAPDTCDPASAS